MRVMAAANEQLSVQHPEVPRSNRINIVTAVAAPHDVGHTYRNVHVFGARQFDRSPGGTGTCARMAVLLARGELSVGEEVRVESVTGGVFRGRILEETTLAGRQAIVPEITGSAHITRSKPDKSLDRATGTASGGTASTRWASVRSTRARDSAASPAPPIT